MHTCCIDATITHTLTITRATHMTKVTHQKKNFTQKSCNKCSTFVYTTSRWLPKHAHKLHWCSNYVEFSYDKSYTHNKLLAWCWWFPKPA
jgi:ssDNA-binding Zn-finger/Zn-ribbon topoisomerase 1